MTCPCGQRGYVRSIEEDDPGVRLLDHLVELKTIPTAFLGRCQSCGAWWERVPHYVYGYAWYQIEPGQWDASDEQAAIAGWARARSSIEA